MASHIYEDEEDEVLGEVDVYLSKPQLQSELHVLQYPLRNARIGIGTDRKVVDVNVRPRHGRIEINVAVMPDNPDPEEISSTEGCAKSFDLLQERLDEKSIGNVQCLRSRLSRTAPDSNYAIGSYAPPDATTNNKPSFTIVPVRSVSQLRPTFDYIDKHDMKVAQQRAEEKAARANVRGEPRAANESAEVAPLEVSFRKRETERAMERRKNSYTALRLKEESEPWVSIQFFSEKQPHSVVRRKALFAPPLSKIKLAVKDESAFDAAMGYMDLYRSHTRHVHLGVAAKGSTDKEPLSRRALKRLPVDSAVAQIITHARLVRFEDMMEIVAEGTSPSEVLSAIRIAAVCLRGCWVAKKGEKVGRGKQKAYVDRYDASRILILDQFRKSRVITEAQACEALGERMLIDHSNVLDILKEVAHMKKEHSWEFRMDDDENFKYEYADLVNAQQMDWDRRAEASREMLAKVRR